MVYYTLILYNLLYVFLVLCSKLGDFTLQLHSEHDFVLYVRAIFDNSVHGGIAGISWLMVGTCRAVPERITTRIRETLLCVFLACLIDVDHFIAAKSVRLKSALSLAERPPLHNTTLLGAVAFGLIALAVKLQNYPCSCLGWTLLTAVTTHHIRDGLRRGLWLPPFSKSIPIHPLAYWMFLYLYPFICGTTIGILSDSFSGNKYKALTQETV